MPESCPNCNRTNVRRVAGKCGPDMLRCMDCAATWETPAAVGRATKGQEILRRSDGFGKVGGR